MLMQMMDQMNKQFEKLISVDKLSVTEWINGLMHDKKFDGIDKRFDGIEQVWMVWINGLMALNNDLIM